MTIRKYNSADFEQVIALINPLIPAYFDASEKVDFEQYLLEHLEDYFVVTINSNTIVACGGINYFPEINEARISWDLVNHDFLGKGIGKQLLQHRLQIIKRKPTIKTIVVRTSQKVFPFYQKQGFILQYIKKDFWAPGLDLYYLSQNNQ